MLAPEGHAPLAPQKAAQFHHGTNGLFVRATGWWSMEKVLSSGQKACEVISCLTWCCKIWSKWVPKPLSSIGWSRGSHPQPCSSLCNKPDSPATHFDFSTTQPGREKQVLRTHRISEGNLISLEFITSPSWLYLSFQQPSAAPIHAVHSPHFLAVPGAVVVKGSNNCFCKSCFP